ncbi:MAG: exonuclease domain-containing protein [Candidatus Sericytochromatia bacterium]
MNNTSTVNKSNDLINQTEIVNDNKYNKSLKDLFFVAFDLETTGLFPVTSEIIEIGAVKFNLDGEVSRFQTLIKPNNKISQESFLIHKISDDMLLNKPVISEIIISFLDFIKDTVLVAHNSMFDMSFISYSLIKNKIDFPDNIALDTRILGHNLLPEIGNYRLSTLTNYFGIDSSIFHRAVYDAEYCMNVFLSIINRFFKNTDKLEEVIKYNKTIDFSVISEENDNFNDIPEIYLPIKDSIKDSSKINITYKRHNGEVLNRDITPIGFLRVKNKVYVEAFCHLRGEKRNFKINKILSIN